MDSRLVLAVVLVVVACMTQGAKAMNTTVAPTSNATVAPSSNATVAPSSNATMAPSSNATMAPSSNATMAPSSNATMAPSSNATMAPSGNATMAPSGNATTAAPTTALVLSTNLTVETLTTNISRAECGQSQFCASEPADCNPAVAGSCFFLSTALVSGQTFSFQLSGESSGYIAVGLSADTVQGGNDTTYVCANNNGSVEFFTTLLDNGVLTQTTTLAANDVKGSVSGSVISCTFAATVPSATTQRNAGTSYVVSLSDGTFVNGTLGAPNNRLVSSAPVNLGNPNSTVTNSLNANTTATPATTASHAVTLQQSLSRAVLILLGVLGLTML